jgi:uncharacterized protein
MRSSFTSEEKKYLIFLAQKSIEAGLNGDDLDVSENSPASEKLKQKQSCFVTLTENGNLRGCIGNILPVQELWKDVAENAQSAAFGDPRFSPLTEEELKNINLEISVLSFPEKFKYHSAGELISYLRKNKPGVVIKKGGRTATFLPQVWEEIGEPEEFLSHLCLKAGLSADEWTNGDIEIEVYEAEKIK